MISRLQFRCLATSATAHAFLVAVLLFVPGFRSQRLDVLGSGPPLDMVPGELIDAALQPGPPPLSRSQDSATHSNPTPPVRLPETPPKATPPTPPKTVPKPPPDTPERTEVPTPKAPSEIKFDLPKSDGPGFSLPSSRNNSKDPKKKNTEDTSRFDFNKAKVLKPDPAALRHAAEAERAAAEAEENRVRWQNLARSVASAAGSLERSGGKSTVQVRVSSGVEGGTGGGGGGGGGSAYAWHLRNAYDNAWVAPTAVNDDQATTDIEVVVRRDGRILSARIVKRSGIAALDRSVQDAIDRVKQAPPFEAGATEDQRSYTIGFNTRGKRTF